MRNKSQLVLTKELKIDNRLSTKKRNMKLLDLPQTSAFVTELNRDKNGGCKLLGCDRKITDGYQRKKVDEAAMSDHVAYLADSVNSISAYIVRYNCIHVLNDLR